MDTLLSRTTPEQRRELFAATAARMGIGERLVEKDYWVCWMLRRLFTLPEAARHLTFKGGTSLSKAFGLIARFSEDIDLIIDRSWLGVPDAPSGSPLQWLKKIKKACRYKVRDELLPALDQELQTHLAGQEWKLVGEQESDEDPRVVLFRYPTVLSPTVGGYVQAEVKMEFNARSDADPTKEATVRAYAATEFPAVLPDADIPLRCLTPERTLWEKATLLHEELCRPIEEGVRPRLSRHFYDLAQLLEGGVGERALADLALYDRVVQHRAVFFANDWMGDYSTLLAGPLILKPADDRRADWLRDYGQMGEMFFHEAPAFDDVMAAVEAFATKFNLTRALNS